MKTRGLLIRVFFLWLLFKCIDPVKVLAQTPDILSTIPASAVVFDLKDKKIGTTPLNLSAISKEIEGLKVFAEGYDTTIIMFAKGKKKELLFPASVQFCDPSCSMNFTSLDEKKGSVIAGTLKLRKKPEDHDFPIMVAVDTPLIAISAQTELGKVNSDEKLLKDKDIHQLLGYAENMNVQAVAAFENSYIEASYNTVMRNNKPALFQPKLILKPEVKKMYFNLKGRLLRDYTGPCTVECNWKISTTAQPQHVIKQIPVQTSFYRTADNYELILHQMIYESELDLLENDSLYDMLLSIQKDYLAATKGEKLKIKKPVAITFASDKEMLKYIVQPVVTIETSTGFGSGVLISDQGYIITNFHVIQDSSNIKVRVGSDKKLKAAIVKSNSAYDLALLKIADAPGKLLSLGNSNDVQPGDEVFAVGTPLEKSLNQTITKGIVSGLRSWNGLNFLQTDVSINAGSSGGPLVNLKGEVIGIATMKLFGKGIEGVSFCIPINDVLEMLNIEFVR